MWEEREVEFRNKLERKKQKNQEMKQQILDLKSQQDDVKLAQSQQSFKDQIIQDLEKERSISKEQIIELKGKEK